MQLLFVSETNAQTAKEILQKSKTACQAIEQGTYQMESFMKYMDNTDTAHTSYYCTFKKTKEDTVFSSKFHFTYYYDTTYLGHLLYNGNEYAYSNEDSGTITSALIPWNTCGAYMHSVLQVSPLDYAMYAFFNLINPVLAIIYAYCGIKVLKLTPPDSVIRDVASKA